MPKYQMPDGKDYEFSSDEEATIALQAWQQQFGKEEKPKASLLSSFGRGLKDIPDTVISTGLLGLGGVGAAVGAEDFSNAMFEEMDRRKDVRKQTMEEAPDSEVGKVLRAVGSIPAYLNPLTAGSMISGGAADQATDMVKEGSDLTHAYAAMGTDLATNALGLGIGAKLNVAGKAANALVQGGMNVAQESLINRPIQQEIRESAGVSQLPEYTAGDYAAQFIPGAAIGAMTATPKAKVVDTSVPVEEPKVPAQTDLDQQYIARQEGKLTSIDRQIESVEAKISELLDTAEQRGGFTEKQYKFYQDLTNKRDALKLETEELNKSLTKYQEQPQVKEEVATPEPVGRDVDVTGTTNPFFKAGDPRSIDTEVDSVTGLPKFGESVVTDQLPDRTLGNHDFETGNSVVDQQRIAESWFRGVVQKFPQEVQTYLKSAQDLELFVQIHEILHGKVGVDEAATNRLTFDFLKKYKENPEATIRELKQIDQESRGGDVRSLSDVEAEDAAIARSYEQDTMPVTGKNMYDQNVTDVVGEQARLDAIEEESGPGFIFRKGDGKEQMKNNLRTKGMKTLSPNTKSGAAVSTVLGNFGKGPAKNEGGSWNPFLSSQQKAIDDAAKVARITDFDKFVDPSNMRTADDLWNELGALEGAVDKPFSFERAFAGVGQFVEAVKRQSPIVWEIAKRIKKANDVETELKRTLWHGDASKGATKGLGPFMSLAHYKNPDSLAVVTKQMTSADKVAVHKKLLEVSEQMIHPRDVDLSDLTPIQQKAYKLVRDLYDRVQKTTGVRQRYGYIHATRRGDYVVVIKTSQGDPTHIESFKSPEQAQQLINKAKKAGLNVEDRVIDLKDPANVTMAESFSLVRDLMDDLNQKLELSGKGREDIDAIQNFLSTHATIGKHNVRKEGYTGAEGTRLFKTDHENAADYFKSLENYTGEVASQWKKTLLNRDVNEFFNTEAGNKLQEKFPNQTETARYLVDIANNTHKKYGIAEKIDEYQTTLDNMFAKKMNQYKEGDEPLYYPDVHVADRAMGIAAQLFYIKVLTTRPGFWAGQLLSSPFAVRQFLKEGSVLDTLTAQGKGWGTVMTGGDKDFKAFIQNMKETTDSLHPQFTNDINSIPLLGEGATTTLGKIMDWATGQKPAAISDTLSRYFTTAMAYHFYKDMGYSGDKLKGLVTQAVDNTMVMYGRESTSPFLQKLGTVGQAIAPLQKYGIAQIENLVGDLRYMMTQPDAKSKMRASLPAINTLLTTMIMGGTTGVMLLAEYDAIRGLIKKFLESIGANDLADKMPNSVMMSMLSHDNILTQGMESMYKAAGASDQFAADAATHGIPSAATGFDIGSSLRFQPFVPGIDNTREHSFLDLIPVVKSLVDLADFGIVKGKSLVNSDNVTEAEIRKAELAQQYVVGQRYLVDKLKYGSDTREFVPGGGRGYAQVRQTPEEQMAQLIGSQTISSAKDKAIYGLETKYQKELVLKRQKAIDLVVDGVLSNKQSKIDNGLDLAARADMTPQQIKDAIKSALVERNTPRREDLYGKASSIEQKRKLLRDMQYQIGGD